MKPSTFLIPMGQVSIVPATLPPPQSGARVLPARSRFCSLGSAPRKKQRRPRCRKSARSRTAPSGNPCLTRTAFATRARLSYGVMIVDLLLIGC